MPLQGTFDVLTFPDTLRLLARQSATGRVHVRSRSFGANLFVEDGELVGADQSEHQSAATVGDVRGRIEEVCFEMLEAERGSFEFHPTKPSSLPLNERYRVDLILADARKRLEEWHELQEVIPSLDLQPRLVFDIGHSEVTIDKSHWRFLTVIDGRRNLRAIGRALNLSDFDVCRAAKALLDSGIIELDGRAGMLALAPTVPPPESAMLEALPYSSSDSAPWPGSDAHSAGSGYSAADQPSRRSGRPSAQPSEPAWPDEVAGEAAGALSTSNRDYSDYSDPWDYGVPAYGDPTGETTVVRLDDDHGSHGAQNSDEGYSRRSRRMVRIRSRTDRDGKED